MLISGAEARTGRPPPVSALRDHFRSLSDMPLRPDLHTVAVLALPDVVPFDLVIPGQIFGDPRAQGGTAHYRMLLCGPAPGLVPMAGGVPVGVPLGVEALREADTIVVPGRSVADAPVPEHVVEALQEAAVRGARLVSICTGAFVL